MRENNKSMSNTLSDKLSITVDENERELFMSFGLLNELTTIIGDPARVSAVAVDPELRTEVLCAALAERKRSGKIIKAVDFDDLDISVEDVENVISWVMEHSLSFFVRSLRKVVDLTKAHQGEMTDLASSLAGSPSSPSSAA